MMFMNPVWLMLLIPVCVVLWLLPMPNRALQVLRGLLCLLIILALCQPTLMIPGPDGTVVVVADRSQSMPTDASELQRETIRHLQTSAGEGNHLSVVAFGRREMIERSPGGGDFSGFIMDVGSDQSDLASALESAASLVPRNGVGRILVLSDGRWTGSDPMEVGAHCAARGIPIDYRWQRRSLANDLAIDHVQAPREVSPGVGFLINAWVQAPQEGEITYRLKRGQQVIASGKRTVEPGLNRLTFRDLAGDGTVLAYDLTVSGTTVDPVPENNEAHVLVGVRGGKPVLCVTDSKASGLVSLLTRGGVRLETKAPGDCQWGLEDLAGYSSVILENVRADEIGSYGMRTLAAWVEHGGAGLMMTGGRRMYGQGGYYKSPLDPIMPVSMEMRKEHRKFSVAISIAMDRSGSMAAPVGGGKTKMDLANLGAVQVMDMLNDQDEIGVIAVDSSPHTLVGMGSVEAGRGQRHKILTSQSMGGGIFIYEALLGATKEVQKAQSASRHIVLFADAADSEEPGNYRELLANCAKAGITVSVIGMGTEQDCDAMLLKDIALRGGGECYFSHDPGEIPRLFAQDTFTITRSAMIEEATPVKMSGSMTMLTGAGLGQPPPVGGYNLSFLKQDAHQALVSEDEFAAPITAFWSAGSGRVVCHTGEADGDLAGAFAKWEKVGEFYTSLSRWAAGELAVLPSDVVLKDSVVDGVYRVELHLDPDRQLEPFEGVPNLAVLKGNPGETPSAANVSFHWQDPDLLLAEVPLNGDETVLGRLEVKGVPAVSLAPARLPYSPEFRPGHNEDRDLSLKKLANLTGGRERVDLAGIWDELPTRPVPVPIAHWLAIAAMVLLLVEILERRMGFLMGRVKLSGWSRSELEPRRPRRGSGPARDVDVAAPRRKAQPFKTATNDRGSNKLDIPTGASTSGRGLDAGPSEQPPVPPPQQDEGSTLDAMRKARERLKGRGNK